MKRTLIAAAVFGGLLSFGGAHAVQYTWDLSNPIGGQGSAHTKTFSSIQVPGQVLSVSAYRSANTDNSGANMGTGYLQNAQVNPDGGFGLGVYSSGEDDTDARLLDNKNGFEVLVFDSGVANFDWDAVELGHIWSGNPNPALTYWTGGANGGISDWQFNNMCLRTTGSGCTSTLQASGFSAPTTMNGLGAGSTLPLTTEAKGRYLVVSGALYGSEAGSAGGYDKFKISTVPTPQTAALLGVGMLAMFAMRRRRSASGGALEA